MQENHSKLKEFIRNKTKDKYYNTLKIAIEVCLETQNINLALYIAKQKQMDDEIMEILISKLNKISDALDYLLPAKNNEKENEKNVNFLNEEKNVNEKIKLILKYGEYFLDKKNGEISDIFFNRVSSFIEEKNSYLDKRDIINLIQIFIVSDKYFKSLFDKMDIYGIEYNSKIIHRRIELYLDDKEKNYTQKIIQMLTDKKYINKYNIHYLLLLFKYHNFIEGTEVLTTIINNKQDLVQLYVSKSNYDKLIELIDEIIANSQNNTDKKNQKIDIDISFISIILKYFIEEKKKNKKNNNIDAYIQKIINKVTNNNIFLPNDFLDILFELNDEFSINDINYFINNNINKELVSIGTYIYRVNEIKRQLNETESKIKELSTKAICFKLNKCDECNMAINFPCLCFYCGHCYHQLCINAIGYDKSENENNEINNNKLKCPKCRKILNQKLEK